MKYQKIVQALDRILCLIGKQGKTVTLCEIQEIS